MQISHIAYRGYQAGLGLALRAASPKQETLCGPGVLMKLPARLAEDGISRILLVTTAGTYRRGTLNPFIVALGEHGIEYRMCNWVEPDPTDERAAELARMYMGEAVDGVAGEVGVPAAGESAAGDAAKDEPCQAIVAVGGGSVMDCSKAAAALIARPGRSVSDLAGLLKVRRRLLPIYAVPTTAGTGSEYTPAAVITDTSVTPHVKRTIDDFCLVPKLAVLDPELTLTLPPRQTAQCGVDALCHAVEAYTNLNPSKLVRERAIGAVRRIFAYLPVAFLDGQNLEARGELLQASYDAGVAFGNNMVGYVHAIAHGIGALYGLPHGEAVGIVLPYVLDQYGEAVWPALARLARCVGLDADVPARDGDLAVDGDPAADGEPSSRAALADDGVLANRFIASIRDMEAMMGIPAHVEALREEDFGIIVDRAIAEANPNYPVPQIWGRAEFERVLRKLLSA